MRNLELHKTCNIILVNISIIFHHEFSIRDFQSCQTTEISMLQSNGVAAEVMEVAFVIFSRLTFNHFPRGLRKRKERH